MSTSFRPGKGLVVVRGDVVLPTRRGVLGLSLDTGSTHTMLHSDLLASLGLGPSRESRKYRVTTASGVVSARRVIVPRFIALGEERIDFPVVSHNLTAESGIDGLLGLDFIGHRKLMIDFAAGSISLD